VLLLDEVDALVSRRGDNRSAHHDDVLTSTLLTLLDTHDGVVVMTTNRPATLDPALARRIGWHLDVPLPDARARLKIWSAMLPETAPLHPELKLRPIAARHALSGGDIRTLAMRAAAHAATTGQLITARLLDRLATELVASSTSGRHLRMGPASA
jgi:SpoVK/Ycf46/Vps4 family AAA+-type ATPase